MTKRRLQSILVRAFVALFALWLPVATGQGGKATCAAAASFAKTLGTSARPHLSCHGENTDDPTKQCCCKSRDSLRSAACGCHDGDSAFGAATFDPLLVSWLPVVAPWTPNLRPAFDGNDRVLSLLGDAPESPPPERSPLRRS